MSQGLTYASSHDSPRQSLQMSNRRRRVFLDPTASLGVSSPTLPNPAAVPSGPLAATNGPVAPVTATNTQPSVYNAAAPVATAAPVAHAVCAPLLASRVAFRSTHTQSPVASIPQVPQPSSEFFRYARDDEI